MTYLLLSVSMLSMVLQNGIFNSVSKSSLKDKADRFYFNSYTYLICFLLFLLLAFSGSFSIYSLGLGLLFGAVTMLSGYYKLSALSKGPMHITTLITSASMIIPAMSGAMFFGERFSVGKAFAIILLIFFIYISLKKDNNTNFCKGWFVCIVLAFLFQGAIGILQKIHQTSSHKNELVLFLGVAFLFSFAFSMYLAKREKNIYEFKKKEYIFAIICGVCTFAMNYINLKLSGLIPTQLFFPLVNGSSIILTALVSIFIFKETVTKHQVVGLAGGLLSLVLICIL